MDKMNILGANNPLLLNLYEVALFKEKFFPCRSPLNYSSLESLLLRKGTLKITQSDSYLPSILNESNQCFRNTFLASLLNLNLYYTEGYIFYNNSLLFHSWCVNNSGQIFDPTLHNVPFYLGITFQTDFITSYSKKTGFIGILDRPDTNFEVLRNFNMYEQLTLQI